MRTALANHAIEPDRLVLEITETVLVHEIESASTILAELRDLGVGLAIDDFGTGYCSLSYLQRFPVDVVKIDREFVSELGEGQRSSTLVYPMLTSLLRAFVPQLGSTTPFEHVRIRRKQLIRCVSFAIVEATSSVISLSRLNFMHQPQRPDSATCRLAQSKIG